MHSVSLPKGRLGLAASALCLLIAGQTARAESRSYVVSYFTHATSSVDGDCPGGLNPKMDIATARALQALGYSGKDVEQLMQGYGDELRSWDKDKVGQLMNERARVNGKPANAYAHPEAVADANLKYVTGKYAYGFNLDGRGADDPKAFEDPVTHEKGVDNQMFRALGCNDPFRGSLEAGTAFWLFMWMAEKDSMPAWLVTIDGADVNKDGPVTVSFARALDVTKFDANGDARADMTYRQDPDPRFRKNTYKGEIKNGVVSLTEHGALHMVQDQLTFPNFDITKLHLRLTLSGDGRLAGFVGGYQPIEQVYFAIAQGGHAAEDNYAPEAPGIYHLLRKLADADPDANGQNWSISTAYYIRAVPAFILPAKSERVAAEHH